MVYCLFLLYFMYLFVRMYLSVRIVNTLGGGLQGGGAGLHPVSARPAGGHLHLPSPGQPRRPAAARAPAQLRLPLQTLRGSVGER
jgi:hypothetical protein